ncbi:hypothetical protein MUP77_13725 [Candidatus Bathyarchaeota archaeon]|nr:hypothetical protein [Candidatus Bathyarchaeota archaeon]
MTKGLFDEETKLILKHARIASIRKDLERERQILHTMENARHKTLGYRERLSNQRKIVKDLEKKLPRPKGKRS